MPLKDGDRIALLRERGAGMETLLELLGLFVQLDPILRDDLEFLSVSVSWD